MDAITWRTNHGDTVLVWASGDYHDDARLRWYYRVLSRNGRIVEHGHGYIRRRNAVRAALRHHPRVEDQ